MLDLNWPTVSLIPFIGALLIMLNVGVGAISVPTDAKYAGLGVQSLGAKAAPVAPEIAVERVLNTHNARLSWLHVIESTAYQVWRGTSPYFDPDAGQGNQIQEIPAAPFGQGTIVLFTDDGVDHYPADGTIPPVTVIGNVTTNYFWVVRGANSDGVSGNSNLVGEFDFQLVPGS